MQGDLNGQDKKAIAQYISDTLSKYEIFQKEKYQQSKQYEDKLMALNIELSQEKQKSELLQQELNEMKQRLDSFKKQQSILNLLKVDTPEKKKQDNSEIGKINQMSSIIQIDQEKVKQIEVERNKFKRMYEQSEIHCQRLKEQNEQCQKQISILTDYINEKQVKTNERMQKLEQQLEDVEIRHRKQDLQTIKSLQKEKKTLEAKIEKCTGVVKELEQYYLEQIRELERQINAVQESLKSTLKSKVEVDKLNANLTRQLEDIKRNIEQDLNQIARKREEQKHQFDFSQKLVIQTFKKKIQIMQEDFKRVQEQYKDKISFLIIKLQQSNHPVSDMKRQASSKWRFQPGMNLHDMSVCESQSVSYRVEDSMRFDSTSIARSIKQNLMKPNKRVDISAHKQFYDVTPVKSSNSNSALSERTNIM